MPRFRGLTFEPLTPANWSDLETLFGPRGACGGCWCMTPRLTAAEYEKNKGEANRRALRRIVQRGTEPGVLAYRNDEPVAWCAIEPRTAYPRLDRSRILQPVDDTPVWSIVCLFVRKDLRRAGVSVRIIGAAVDHARGHGATCVEAYPVEPKKDPMPAVFAYTGTAEAYRRAGFHEVARRSETRPIMRKQLRPR